jgi:hypothetical protein
MGYWRDRFSYLHSFLKEKKCLYARTGLTPTTMVNYHSVHDFGWLLVPPINWIGEICSGLYYVWWLDSDDRRLDHSSKGYIYFKKIFHCRRFNPQESSNNKERGIQIHSPPCVCGRLDYILWIGLGFGQLGELCHHILSYIMGIHSKDKHRRAGTAFVVCWGGVCKLHEND